MTNQVNTIIQIFEEEQTFGPEGIRCFALCELEHLGERVTFAIPSENAIGPPPEVQKTEGAWPSKIGPERLTCVLAGIRWTAEKIRKAGTGSGHNFKCTYTQNTK
jgi:hypothetical protein